VKAGARARLELEPSKLSFLMKDVKDDFQLDRSAGNLHPRQANSHKKKMMRLLQGNSDSKERKVRSYLISDNCYSTIYLSFLHKKDNKYRGVCGYIA